MNAFFFFFFFSANEGLEGEGKGKGIGSEALAGTGKNCKRPQPVIEPGTPANAADALPLILTSEKY